jgi:hypothetical protein
MNAKIIIYNIDTGKTIRTLEENVVVTLGEYPEQMPIVSVNLDDASKFKKNENVSIDLNIEELQKEISLSHGLKWLKNNRVIK